LQEFSIYGASGFEVNQAEGILIVGISGGRTIAIRDAFALAFGIVGQPYNASVFVPFSDPVTVLVASSQRSSFFNKPHSL
jgi:hypothetical protein